MPSKFAEANKEKLLDKRVVFLRASDLNESQEFYAVGCAGINTEESRSLPAMFVRTFEEAENLQITLNATYKIVDMTFYILKHEAK